MQADDDVPPGVDINCMASNMVSELGGADGMAAHGVTVETIAAGNDLDSIELPRAEAVSMADGVFGCGFMDLMIDQMAGTGMSDDDASCLADNLDQDSLRDLFAADFMTDAEADVVGEDAESRMLTSLISASVNANSTRARWASRRHSSPVGSVDG